MALITLWLGSIVAAIAGVTLLRGSKTSQPARLLSVTGCVLPLLIALVFGTHSRAFMFLMPLGLILTAAGGLLFSNIEDPKQKTTPVYAAVFTAIFGFSLTGWAIVSAN